MLAHAGAVSLLTIVGCCEDDRWWRHRWNRNGVSGVDEIVGRGGRGVGGGSERRRCGVVACGEQ